METSFDVVIVGAGIVGLAHALAARRRGLSALVLDRDSRAVGASIRNFGFVTVTGQAYGPTWNRARVARNVWAEIAPPANIPVIHRGTALVARRPEAVTVLEQFASGPMGAGCEWLESEALARRLPMARPGTLGGLWSPHELRVEPRTAIPALRAWLESRGVAFVTAAVTGVSAPVVETTVGRFQGGKIIVCPGTDLRTLFPDVIARHKTTLCKLHMLRLAPQPDGWRLPAAVMMDLSYVRYGGYLDLPGVPALRARLEAEAGESLANGIHIIIVQSADGSLVVGDSHHYHDTPDPFAPERVDELILGHTLETIAIPDPRVIERWIGVYPSSPMADAMIEAPDAGTRVVLVTSGTGMSTAFGLAEEVVTEFAGTPTLSPGSIG